MEFVGTAARGCVDDGTSRATKFSGVIVRLDFELLYGIGRRDKRLIREALVCVSAGAKLDRMTPREGRDTAE
jgi:hypothetical protein